jgi:hypothetical protein
MSSLTKVHLGATVSCLIHVSLGCSIVSYTRIYVRPVPLGILFLEVSQPKISTGFRTFVLGDRFGCGFEGVNTGLWN